MADPIENRLVDKRVAQRYLRKGKLPDKQYDAYLETLPDLADQALPVEASMGGGDEPDLLDVTPADIVGNAEVLASGLKLARAVAAFDLASGRKLAAWGRMAAERCR